MSVVVLKNTAALRKAGVPSSGSLLWCGDTDDFLDNLDKRPVFDLVVTSPPYNLGKSYEKKAPLDHYLESQARVISKIVAHLRGSGSICWQIGNFVENGHFIPLDIELHPIFRGLGLKLRNRIIWRFGHGLHSKRRFSGRYEVILWYTKSDSYYFDLDAVRVPSKYPAKRFYKGPNVGKYSSHPGGKNPEDVWDGTNDLWEIPNVKSNHVEKTHHPCQFPVGLIERLVLALTPPDGLVFDPFAGVGSAGAAALLHGRRFWGCELSPEYVKIAEKRMTAAAEGTLRYRPHDKPIYDHTRSKLSIKPQQVT